MVSARRGFNLIEIMVSAALLCLVFTNLVILLPCALLAVQRTAQESTAGSVGLSVLEGSRAARFSSLVPGTSALPDVVVNNATYHESLTVIQLAPTLKRLQVVVTYEDPGSRTGGGTARPRQVTLNATVCRVQN